jgi:hypothetical protein
VKQYRLACLFITLSYLLVIGTANAATVFLAPSNSGASLRFVHLEGQIVGGEAKELELILRQAAPTNKAIAVWLDSVGGDVDEAMAIGQVIRAAGATTFHGYCASACVYAFLGGRERFVSLESGSLSVHRPTLAEANIALPTDMGTRMLNHLRSYIVAMSGSDAFYQLMMSVPFATPQTLLPAEALAMGVATRQQQ